MFVCQLIYINLCIYLQGYNSFCLLEIKSPNCTSTTEIYSLGCDL